MLIISETAFFFSLDISFGPANLSLVTRWFDRYQSRSTRQNTYMCVKKYAEGGLRLIYEPNRCPSRLISEIYRPFRLLAYTGWLQNTIFHFKSPPRDRTEWRPITFNRDFFFLIFYFIDQHSSDHDRYTH